MDILFKTYLCGKKIKITGQQVITEVYMWDKEAIISIGRKHAGIALQGHTVKNINVCG